MLNIGRIRPGGAEYYVGEIALSAEAYYLGRGEAPGCWVGSLAEEMGLRGEVDPDHFRALLEGKHPFTAERLVVAPRAKAPTVSQAPEGEWLSATEAAAQLGVSSRFVRRILATGVLEGEKARSETTGRVGWRVQRSHVNTYAVSHKPSKRRPGFDLTLRPPKSVSILWALGNPDRRAAIRQAHRAAIDDYRDGRIDEALGRYDVAGRIIRRATARETYDALVQDWWADRLAGSTAPMLAGTNAARGALNARARAMLKAEEVLMGAPLVAHGREFMVGDEVVARRNDRTLRSHGRSEFVKNGSTGWVVGVDVDRGEIVVDFTNEGPITIPRGYLEAGHMEHGYARTTYGVQGATLDRARYHPTDASRFEEGYVAVTRATERTQLYIVEGDLDIDDETGHHVIERPETGARNTMRYDVTSLRCHACAAKRRAAADVEDPTSIHMAVELQQP